MLGNSATGMQLTIIRPNYERGKSDVEIFAGSIQNAVAKFNAVSDTANQPREWQMLEEIEGALYRAEEEIHQSIKGTPDPATQATLDDLGDAGRASCLLRQHLEQDDPWRKLGRIEKTLSRLRNSGETCQPTALPAVDATLAMEAHRRFQRE